MGNYPDRLLGTKSISPLRSPLKSAIRKIRRRRCAVPKYWASYTHQARSTPRPRTIPAFAHRPEPGIGTSASVNASSTALKSRREELDKAPGTFSQSANFGYSPLVASCISLMILMASRKRPLRSPARPSRLPDATLRSWQGEPKVMMSTGGSLPPWSFVMSPKCSMSGKCFFVTETHSGTISLAHRGLIP